jgi:hypothetical protein
MQDGRKSVVGFLRGIEWIVFHGHLDYFQKPPSCRQARRTTVRRPLGDSKRSQPLVYPI